MKTKIPSKSHPVTSRSVKGFTLVMCLSLIVLLAVLAVGILSLSAVTLRNSAQGGKQAEARSNARLAMMLALGELQKQLGPDQRISAQADQRNNPGEDGSTSSAAAGNRYWTGVYDSWTSTAVNRPSPTFRSWLVSGNLATLSNASTADQELASTASMELVGRGTVGDITTGLVRVPTLPLTTMGNAKSRLAWWVGDEGVKAALANPIPPNDMSQGFVRNSLQSAARNAVELAGADSPKPFAALSATDSRKSRVTSWSQSGFVASDIMSPRLLFHDLAASSSGLLTNVRAGGFRKDLSMKLESYTSPPDLLDPTNVLYTVQGEEGVNFQELWSYYRLYSQLRYGGGGTYTTGGSIPNNSPYLRTADTLSGLTSDTWDRYKHPITINYQNVLSFEMRPAPKDAGKQALFLNMDPIVTLWNPLDVAVDISPHQNAQGANKCMMYVYWVIPYDINVQINGGAIRRCSVMRSVYNKDFTNSTGGIDYNMIRLNVGEVERLTMKPGEVLKISQTGATQAGNGGFVGLNGTKGFNYGGGARFALLDENGQYLLLEPNDQITYTVSPNNLTSGRDNASGGNIIAGFSQQNSRRWSMSHNSVVMGSPWGENVHMGVISIDHCYGYRRAKVGETRSSSNKTLSNSQRVFASDVQNAEAFPIIQGIQQTRVISAASINSRKAPFMVHSYSVKTELENQRGTRMMARFNPKAHNVDFFNLSTQERDMMPYQVSVTPLTSWLNAPLDESTNGQGFFGSSLAAQFGSNFVVTHSVPRQPIVSLAAFQNSFANGFNRLNESFRTEHAMARLPLLPQISHAIGNSLAPAVIAPDRTEGNLANDPRPLADHSYLANRALWDDWFLSGIAPQPTAAFSSNRSQKTVATEFFSGLKPLPTTRYLATLDGQNATTLANSFFSGNTPNLEAINNIASYLRVDGLFNVNSTSVEAWKTLLGSLKNLPIVIRAENGSESIASKDGNTPIAAIQAPRDVISRDEVAMKPEQWNGRRTLTDMEIESLARGIVKEVRKRGPFLSLSDFVNRRVGTDKKLAQSGAIQSALDSPDVTINKNQNTGRAVASAISNRFAFPEAEIGSMAYGAPSIVKQGDILTPIAPILSARSDTFLIRSYGEATDATGNVVARAWCEAQVTRDRNFVNLKDKAETSILSLTQSTNKTFGRRFLITSFRWMNPQDI